MHRVTLAQMWPFLFTLATRLDVQVFATTHSWDCIASFAAAAKESDGDDGALIRLERRDGKIIAVSYDEETLSEATEDGIEVR
jgi:predicted ATP-dependent endonuclease of OLD family